MDNTQNELENDLLEIFLNDHVDPSKDWLNLPVKELIKQLENFKQKRTQLCTSEKDLKRKASIVDGLYINALLTLVHGKFFLEKGECLESAASTITVVEQTSETPIQFSSSFDDCVKSSSTNNLDGLLSWQEAHLVYLADLFPSSLDLKKSRQDRGYLNKTSISQSYDPIGEWQRRHIKWQAAAHIFWLDKEANTEKIKNELLHNPKKNSLSIGVIIPIV